MHPAIIKLLTIAINSANKAGVPIAVCGEMAGEHSLTRLLLGLGLRDFSMHPSHLLEVKQRVLQTDLAPLAPIVERIRRSEDAARTVALLERLNA
jgi:phosphotransferase system enzyme I (PtsI)